MRGFEDGHSRYKDALTMNLEIAEQIVAAQETLEQMERDRMFLEGTPPPDEDEIEDPRDTPTSSFGWDPGTHLLAQLNDSVKVLTATLIGVNLPRGKTPPKVKPTPRPVTAVEAVKRRKSREEAADALKQLGF